MVGAQVTRQRVHPILRNPDERKTSRDASPARRSRPSSETSMSPQSQVRFSIPDPQYVDEAQLSISDSSSKIVFPKGCEDDSEYETANESVRASIQSLGKDGHFMDMHSRVMIDVPEEIWDFHTRKRLGGHRRSNSSRSQSMDNGNEDLSKSLQSIIVDTLDSMGTYKEKYLAENPDSGNSSSISQMSPLNLRREPKSELYLTTYSPLNNHNVPIPLEISLPPFLSPKNKRKKRNSLIFDGTSYSPFVEDPYEGSEEENVEEASEKRQLTDTEDELSISDGSIPPAVHDISFDVGSAYNIDQELGIDKDANVNLKIQRKNLRKHSPDKKPSKGYRTPSPSPKKPPINTKTKQLQRPRGIPNDEKRPELSKSRRSLDILETPFKQISIPDFEHEPASTTSTGSLKFFDSFEEPELQLQSRSPTNKTDRLDMNYKFPLKSPDPDFTKVDNSPTSSSFERRRERLIQQKSLPSGGHRHMHSRSRSIHGVGDMFAASSTSPSKKSPELRQEYLPKSKTAFSVDDEYYKPKNSRLSETGQVVFNEEELPVTPLPFEKFGSNTTLTRFHPVNNSSQPSDMKSRHNPVSFQEKVYEVPMTPDSEARDAVESDASSVYEDVHQPQKTNFTNLEEPTLKQKNGSSQDYSKYDKTDESVKILSEKRLVDDHFDFSEEFEEDDMVLSTPVKQSRTPSPISHTRPMTSIQSFNRPIIPPKSDYEQIVSMPIEPNRLHYNLLSPRRSLSNLGSQSSKNSEFSKQTNQSSRTSYPVEHEIINPLVNRLKNSDYPGHSEYPPIPRSSEPTYRAYEDHDENLPSFRRQNEENDLMDTDKDFVQQGGGISNNHKIPKTLDRPRIITSIPNKVVDGNYPDVYFALAMNPETGATGIPESHITQKNYKAEECYIEEEVQESSEPNGSQIFLRPHDSHISHKSIEHFEPEDLYGPQNYQMIEDYQSIKKNTELEEDHSPSGDALEGETSCTHRLAASSDFREVFETLDNMSPTSNKCGPSVTENREAMVLQKLTNSKASHTVKEDYHTEYEVRDGKVVEVLVLNDDSLDSTKSDSGETSLVTPTRRSENGSQNRSHEEILKMCEDTASHAKMIIMELVEEKKTKTKTKTQTKKILSRPLPPNATEVGKPGLPTSAIHPTTVNSSQGRYLKNLNRARRPQPI
ncbi:uncharacterized protein ZBAI_03643 [Zygosaccharomyces bailii ISA1307]|nr:uncharacterized protein ZBAI_03643 [Zygosaccharomyces bailii ISA1307]